MNLLIIPFHDWRKIVMEGFRTRDAHFIEELSKDKEQIKVIVNRPTTLLEILLKRRLRLISGEVVLSERNFKLYKLDTSLYLIDFVSYDYFGQVTKGYRWFVEQYGNRAYVNFIHKALDVLEINDNTTELSQNVFAYKLSENLKLKNKVFDAWDNFLKFKVYKKIRLLIHQGYKSYAGTAESWITNSKDNIRDFSKLFNPRRIQLITNGVDLTRFQILEKGGVPEDLQDINRPIVGFGGKITQLIDVDLMNTLIRSNPDISFVFVGQLLDKEVFKRLVKAENFHYLGDKHYDTYPNYVKNFDVCIVPYVTKEELKSGANSIKVYEYLSTGKKVVGTNGNGLEELTEYLYVVDSPEEFSKELRNFDVNTKKPLDVSQHSWQQKIEELNNLF